MTFDQPLVAEQLQYQSVLQAVEMSRSELRRDSQRERERRDAQEQLILELRQDFECERRDREFLGQRVLRLEESEGPPAATRGADSIRDLEARLQDFEADLEVLVKRLSADVLPAVEALCANVSQEVASRRAIVDFVNKLSQDICHSRAEARGREKALEQALGQSFEAAKDLEVAVALCSLERLETGKVRELAEGGTDSSTRCGSSSIGAQEIDLDARLMELDVAQGPLRGKLGALRSHISGVQKAACARAAAATPSAAPRRWASTTSRTGGGRPASS